MSQDGMVRLSRPTASRSCPCFVNKDYVTAEIPYSTGNACHKVPAWSQATLCCMPVWALPRKQGWLLLRHSCVCWVSHRRREDSMSTAMTAVSVRREQMCLQFLWLLESPSRSLLAHTLPTLGSANSVNPKTVGTVNRISNTQRLWATWQSSPGFP